MRQLITRPSLALVSHDEGRLMYSVEEDEFKTPPCPQMQVSAGGELGGQDEDLGKSLPPDDELLGMYEEEKH